MTGLSCLQKKVLRQKKRTKFGTATAANGIPSTLNSLMIFVNYVVTSTYLLVARPQPPPAPLMHPESETKKGGHGTKESHSLFTSEQL